jgi:zinc transport system permease protein
MGLTELFTYTFIRNAFLAGIPVAFIAGLLSFFVYHRKLAFLGVGVSHIAFGGLALGSLTGLPPYLCGMGFATASTFFIAGKGMEDRREDILVGILFSFSMALGLILLSYSKGYTTDLFAYLFGDILSVTSGDLLMAVSLLAVCGLLIALLFKEFVLVVFDPDFGRVVRYPVRLVHHLLLVMIAVTVVVSIKIVGLILIEGLIIIPGAVAANLASRYRPQMALSAAASVLSVCCGILLSAWLNWPAGATVIAVLALAYFVSLVFRRRGI